MADYEPARLSNALLVHADSPSGAAQSVFIVHTRTNTRKCTRNHAQAHKHAYVEADERRASSSSSSSTTSSSFSSSASRSGQREEPPLPPPRRSTTRERERERDHTWCTDRRRTKIGEPDRGRTGNRAGTGERLMRLRLAGDAT